jgi:hypothetical protein
MAQHQKPVLLVLSYELPKGFADSLGASFIISFEGSQAGFLQSEPACSEDYWLYEVGPDLQSSQTQPAVPGS